MNDVYKDKLRLLAEDELMLQAIRVLADKVIEEMKPNIGENDNQVVGEKFRAYVEASEMVTKILQDVEAYKESRNEPKVINKER